MDELEGILAIDGVDMVCFGPNDLSGALTGRFDIQAPEIREAMDLVLRKCREKGVMAFTFANTVDYARPLVEAGWDMVAARNGFGVVLGCRRRSDKPVETRSLTTRQQLGSFCKFALRLLVFSL
jgi:4-hydroxy-2-oxoheptanedioate aldolase